MKKLSKMFTSTTGLALGTQAWECSAHPSHCLIIEITETGSFIFLLN